MANKRKRDELADSDSDEITPGKQILPVANLPNDFDREPQDGMEYLFLVRRDARRMPHITRAKNPYEVPETTVARMPTPLSTDVLPCQGWRVAFRTHFSNLRRNLIQAMIHVDNHSGSGHKIIPEKKNRDAWWKFLVGYPEAAWSSREGKKLSMSYCTRALTDPTGAVWPENLTSSQDVQPRNKSPHLPLASFHDLPRNILQQPDSPDLVSKVESTDIALFVVDPSISEEAQKEYMAKLSPPKVTTSHLKEIDHRTSMHLLMYFTHWINIHLQNPSDPMTAISLSHGQWIFALLARVEDELSADEMSLLRNLARACLGLIQSYDDEHAKRSTISEGDLVRVEDGIHMSEASCWMAFAAVAEHWGQKDLWADANAALAGV